MRIRLSVLTLLLVVLLVPFQPVASQSDPPTLPYDTMLGRGWIHELVWTPDSQHLLVVSNNALSIYPVGAWDTPQIIEPERPPLVNVALSPDGTQIALLENDLVQILDTTTWAEIRRIETTTYDTYDATGVSLGWVGDYLVVYDANLYGFNVWDSQTGELFSGMASLGGRTILNTTPLLMYDIENEQVTYATLTPDQLRLPDEEGMPIFPDAYGETYAEDETIFGIAPHPLDPTQVVIGVQKESGTYQLVNFSTNIDPTVFIAPPLHEFAFAPDGQNAAMGVCVEIRQNGCGGYEIWSVNLTTGLITPYPARPADAPSAFRNAPEYRLPGEIGAIRYAPSGEFLAATNGQAVRIWNTADQSEVALLHGFSYSVSQLLTTRNFVVALSEVDGVGPSGVTIWNMNTQQSEAYIPCLGPIDVHDELVVCGDELWSLEGDSPTLIRSFEWAYGVYAVAFDPTGSTVAIAYDKGRHIALWPVDDYEPIAEIIYDSIPNWINEMAFSADGQYLLTLPGEEAIIVWDVAKLRMMPEPLVLTQADPTSYRPDLNMPQVVTELGGVVKAMANNPVDGSLVVDQFFGQIQVFDGLTERYTVPLFDWPDAIFPHALAVSQDGAWMAAGGCYFAPHGGWCNESRVVGYDAATGEQVWQIIRTDDRVSSLVFSRDGRWLIGATVHRDNTTHARLVASGGIHLWELPRE